MEGEKLKPILLNTNNEMKIWVYLREGSGKISLSSTGFVIDNKNVDYEITKGALGYKLPFKIDKSQILFRLSDYQEPKNIKKIERLFEEFDINIGTKENVVDRFLEILSDNGYDIDSKYTTDRTWIIAPKFNKKLVGKKNIIEIDFTQVNFDKYTPKYEIKENTTRDIEVFSTTISKDGLTDIKYSMYIPDDLYNALQQLPDEKDRPLNKVLENVLLSGLVKDLKDYIFKMIEYLHMLELEKTYEKVIIIKYSSHEKNVRDDFNFAFIGNEIMLGFRHYIAWIDTKNRDSIFKNNYDIFFTKIKLDNDGGKKEVKSRFSKSSIEKRNEIIIPWTAEREKFLIEIENSFSNLRVNLDRFLDGINADKLDGLIENKVSLHLLK